MTDADEAAAVALLLGEAAAADEARGAKNRGQKRGRDGGGAGAGSDRNVRGRRDVGGRGGGGGHGGGGAGVTAPPTDPGGRNGSGQQTGTVARWNGAKGYGTSRFCISFSA